MSFKEFLYYADGPLLHFKSDGISHNLIYLKDSLVCDTLVVHLAHQREPRIIHKRTYKSNDVADLRWTN